MCKYLLLIIRLKWFEFEEQLSSIWESHNLDIEFFGSSGIVMQIINLK
ncbi:hypothetical protein MICAH_320004 [Microcystis aeruginosa PCC 9809]|uniref:Uncharacterized protein n=1 Tax=Microcystis aeruginosa PCC 9809 TaxID=1160285 RepID=I4HRU1_MICAE|nr:hypothetical protein MICAH_320004 [Microcystis aeruginosa PCC 9809]